VNSSDFALRATPGQEGWGLFCHVAYPETARKAGEFQILCCQGFEVNDYNFTLDALALKPSGFCNVRQLSIQFCAKDAKYFSVSLQTFGIQAFTKKIFGVNFLNRIKVKRSIVI
jgi:hypothetical protein